MTKYKKWNSIYVNDSIPIKVIKSKKSRDCFIQSLNKVDDKINNINTNDILQQAKKLPIVKVNRKKFLQKLYIK